MSTTAMLNTQLKNLADALARKFAEEVHRIRAEVLEKARQNDRRIARWRPT